jgi:hypothetical protein
MGMSVPKVRFSNLLLMFTMLNNEAKLMTIDEKTVVAEFHRPYRITNRQKARLEVQPAGMGMLDHIILTFVIVDQTRREREAAAWRTVPWVIS